MKNNKSKLNKKLTLRDAKNHTDNIEIRNGILKSENLEEMKLKAKKYRMQENDILANFLNKEIAKQYQALKFRVYKKLRK